METGKGIRVNLANVAQEVFVEEESKESPTGESSSPSYSFVCDSSPEYFTKVKYLMKHRENYHTGKGKNIFATSVVIPHYINPF